MRRFATLPLVLLAFPGGDMFTLAGGGPAAPRDGEPAALAGLNEGAPLAALPDGSFLVGDAASVWRVDRQGIMRPVAGHDEFGDSGDGGPALAAELQTDALAALPGGGFAIADDDRLREVGPDGRLRTPKALGPFIEYVAAEADGGLLLASDFDKVLRLAPDGTVTVAARAPAGEHINVDQVAATPDGGFVFSDAYFGSDLIDHTRIWRVAPDGTMTVTAGGGPFVPTAPAGLDQDADGQPAIRAQFGRPRGLAVTADGGVLLGEEQSTFRSLPGHVRYIAPDAPQVLAVAVVRDRDRVFGPGRANAVHVNLTRPATVTLTVAGHTTTAALDAGESRLALPEPLSPQPHAVTVAATGDTGNRAYDRTRIFPDHWLPEDTAQLVVYSLGLGIEVDGCRRFGARRIDCVVAHEDECRGIASVSLVRDRLRWGTYPCRPSHGFHRQPRYSRRPRPLRPGDWRQCVTGCPPALFGRVDESALIPSN